MEPLQSLLSISQDKDSTLREFLPDETVQQLWNVTYVEDDIYLDDRVILVSKMSGLITGRGKVIRIADDHITLKRSWATTYKLSEVYIFSSQKRKTNREKRELYAAILRSLK